MRGSWLSSLPAIWLAACGFGSPDAGGPGGSPDGGGNGGTDGAPACADADRDTVCDAADKCPDHDDRADVDADGIADGCDDWPCGVKPSDPGSTMSDSGNGGDRRWEAFLIDIGDSRRVVASRGQQYSVEFGWRLNIDCPENDTCRAQLEIGYGATRLRCLFDGNVSDEQWLLGGAITQLTAPATPGVHEIRINAGVASSCGTRTTWYDSDPGPESTIAFLCVR